MTVSAEARGIEAELVRARLKFRPANTVTPSRPTWHWPLWLVEGALHLVVARQGGGKSTFAAYVMAQASTGRAFFGEVGLREPLNVAQLSLEEPDDRLVARLHAIGADVDRVLILGTVEDHDDEGRPFDRAWQLPRDCGVLEELIVAEKIGFVVVDGIGYTVAGEQGYAQVGSALSALGAVADRTGCSILGLTHPPKGASDPVTAAIGSTAWTTVPRIVWVLGKDPDDESRRVVRVSKTAFALPDHGVSFVIAGDEQYEVGFVTRLARSHVSTDDLMAAGQVDDSERTERAQAADIVRQVLAEGPMPVEELIAAVKTAGISERTLKRARSDVGVVSRSHKDPKTRKVVGWTVWLPDHLAESPEGQSQRRITDPLDSPGVMSDPEGPEGRPGRLDLAEVAP